ncbi:hypothetical protein QTO34_010759, partial [Cnephaeus nilssonii]
MVKIRVNGFGHIGCLVTRAAFNSGKVDIVTISDRFINLKHMVYIRHPQTMARGPHAGPLVYMFQYDSTHGKFKGTVKAENGKLVINGKSISIFQERDPASIKWVMVVLSMWWSPPVSSLPQRRLGLTWRMEPRGSSSLPLLQMPHVCDVCGWAMWRDGRRSAQSVTPASPGAAKAVSKIIPEVNGKLIGMAFIVPTPTVDLICHLEKAAKYDDIKKQASDGPLKGILGYTEDQWIRLQCWSWYCPQGPLVKLISWYDSEFGYSNRVVDLMVHMAFK